MDSHLLKKASYRPAGPRRPRGAALQHPRHDQPARAPARAASTTRSGERYDVAAALDLCEAEDLPQLWLLGWSFGTDLALKHGCDPSVVGRVLISPPLRYSGRRTCAPGPSPGKPVTALVPEHDDFLQPAQARERFAAVPQPRSSPSRAPSTCSSASPSGSSTRSSAASTRPLPPAHDVRGARMTDLTGKTALVTGASRGIGRAIAVGLARAGADLALSARDEGLLREVQGRGRGARPRAVVLPADVTDADACAQLAADAIAGLGSLDVLVNNAGGSSYMGPFTELRFTGWEKTMRLNVDSIVHLSQAVGRHMVERGSGSVINVASVAGLKATPTLAAYGASKAAVISLTKTLAMEWGPSGVRVNALCPGWTKTDLNANLWGDEGLAAQMVSTTGLKRWGEAEEMVGPTLFLASDASTFVTGQALAVDGGETAG
jgi:2-deoxy-D-gluconate 3-dehydrogenase